jgi:hypothetical protein
VSNLKAHAHDHDWLECTDDSGHRYYFNKVTEECVWEKPPEFHGDVASADDSALLAKIHGVFEGKLKNMAFPSPNGKNKELQGKMSEAKAAQAEKEAAREAAVAAGAEHWVEVYDPGSDSFYYYGSYSADVTWEKPSEYVMAADDELMHAVILIQTAWRGRASRRRVAAMLTKKSLVGIYGSGGGGSSDEEKLLLAATKIQTRFRVRRAGRQVQLKMDQKKAEAPPPPPQPNVLSVTVIQAAGLDSTLPSAHDVNMKPLSQKHPWVANPRGVCVQAVLKCNNQKRVTSVQKENLFPSWNEEFRCTHKRAWVNTCACVRVCACACACV